MQNIPQKRLEDTRLSNLFLGPSRQVSAKI